MRRGNLGIMNPATIIIAALFCCMSIISATPLMAAESTTTETKASPSNVTRIGERINELHSKLKITPQQEEQWNKVAQVMRDNANTMQSLIQSRKEQGTLNAVDDLKAYAKIQDAHAAGLNNFIAAFEPLYSSMSDEQKKIADALFTKHGQHHHGKAKKK